MTAGRARGDVLIGAAALRRRLEAGEPTVLLDVRWRLGDPHGHRDYLAGHLPGAVFVDLERELSGEPGPGTGRHPLPEREAFAAAAAGWGVRPGALAVAYDDAGGTSAARAWWLLRHAGVPAALLDGGLAAWRGAGGRLEPGDAAPPEPGTPPADWGLMPVVDADGAAGWPEAGVLLDARAPERYRGEHEPVDPRAGHIPGAVSLPTAGNLDAHGRFLPAGALAERFAAAGVSARRPAAVYCGSGITAAHEVAALAAAGIDAPLYPGSWSEWCADPARPAATGPVG